MMKLIPVLITTDKRGVFFGYVPALTTDKTVKVQRLRNCVYWSEDCKGFLGLATTGPTDQCRIGPPVDGEAILHGVTCIARTTDAAAKAWEAAPWA